MKKYRCSLNRLVNFFTKFKEELENKTFHFNINKPEESKHTPYKYLHGIFEI
jgi:hypothetical protein